MSKKLRSAISTFDATMRGNSFLYWKKLLFSVLRSNPDIPYRGQFSAILSAERWSELYELADFVSAQKYADARQHFLANQMSLLIRKYPLPSKLTRLEPEALAMRKFLKAEHKCRRINQRFTLWRTKRSPNEPLLGRVRDFITYVIGHEPDLNAVAAQCDFGPGAAVGVHGNATNKGRKLLASSWSVTPGAFDLSYACILSNPQFASLLFEERNGVACYDKVTARSRFLSKTQVVLHNKIVFVPKTAKVHRTIAIEPLLNSYLQKGTDLFIRNRLKRVGIDLSDQLRNQLYAKFGSESIDEDPFVTIDLSSASDSVATEMVRTVLPPAWFALLNALRSPMGKLNDSYIKYEKFCSMGNGFCFPLESLIFTAICIASGAGTPRRDFVVYGDDIIVRKSVALEVITNLKLFGFSLNHEKTFIEGPFRESCGADWFGGIDVRPYTLDQPLDSLRAVFKFLNQINLKESTRFFFRDIDLSFFNIPGSLRFLRPCDGPPDTAVTVPLDHFIQSPYAKWDSHLSCWSWMELMSSSVKDKGLESEELYDKALVYAMLSGSRSEAPFTVRRKSHTKLRRNAYAGHGFYMPAP